MAENNKKWIMYAIITTLFWGVWGALIEIPEKAGFPGTLSYIVWATTMLIPAFFALRNVGWKLDKTPKAIFYGMLIGLLGAGGQMILFTGAIANGPAYLIFPIISLSPVITIFLSMILLRERVDSKGWVGIVLALIAIPLLSYQDSSGDANVAGAWFIFALLVFAAWGAQGYFMKSTNLFMKAESIFFYMTVSGLLLAPIAYFMTDFSQEINYSFKGPGYAFLIQILNSIGALTIVYAFRHGKAMIVSPMTNAVAPVITIVLSLIMYAVFPGTVVLIGMVLAVLSALFLAFE